MRGTRSATVGVAVVGMLVVMGAPAYATTARSGAPEMVSILDEAPVVLALGDLVVADPITGVQHDQPSGMSCHWSAHLSGSWESGGPGTYTAKSKATCSKDTDEIFYSATLYRNQEPVVSANDHCTWPCSYGVADFDQRGCDICGGYFYGYFSIYIVDSDAVWRPKSGCTVSSDGHQLSCRYQSPTQYAPS